MAAKTPHTSAYGNGSGQPSSSLGTVAVKGKSYYNDHSLSPSHHSQNATFDPSASSSSPQHHQHQELYDPSSSYSRRHYQQSPALDGGYDQTLSNTLANSHLDDARYNARIDPDQFYAPAPTRPTGKFTEEWDASQRGSSIINGPAARHNDTNNMGSIQRSNSFSGSTRSGAAGGDMDGSSAISISRSNTLKKKASLRRSASLGRSGSRRSMKAGSVRSLALQSNHDEDEMHNAFYCPVPTTGNPTEALAERFQGMTEPPLAWKHLVGRTRSS